MYSKKKKKKGKDTLAEYHICHPLSPGLGEVIWPAAWMRYLLRILSPGFALLKKLLSSWRVGTPVRPLILRAQEGILRNPIMVPASKNVKKSPAKEFWVCVPMARLMSPSLQSQRVCTYPQTHLVLWLHHACAWLVLLLVMPFPVVLFLAY